MVMFRIFVFRAEFCRQVLSAFCKPDFKIILASSLTDFKVFTLSDLLPESFSL